MPNRFDVAVIGGGLAGLSSAIQFVDAGYKVILFEKEQYPFHKVCGEYISMESWGIIQSLGLDLAGMNLPRITKLHISAPNGNIISHQLNPGGFGISRHSLDFELAKIAQSKGVKLLENTKVDRVDFENEQFSIQSSVGPYIAKLAIGSYGKRANLDHQLSRKFIKFPQPAFRNYIGVKYHIQIDFHEDLIELHNFKDGYCGISKIDQGKYCLCYLTTAKNLQENGGNIRQMEENVLKKNPYLKSIFERATFLYEQPLTISQIYFQDKSQIENHVVMAGDAAGIIAPLCGNGMSMALQASTILFEKGNHFLKEKSTRQDFEISYSQSWKSKFGTRVSAGRLIQHSFGKEAMTNLVIQVLKPFPKVVGFLEGLTHG